MEPQELTKLGELYGQDLAGWQITQCHYLELKHGLMGQFPAVLDADDKEVIAVIEKPLLEKVWKCLPRRSAKVTSLVVVAHPVSGIAFNLEGFSYIDKTEMKPLRIFSGDEIEKLCQLEDSVRWAHGLLSLRDESGARDPVFV